MSPNPDSVLPWARWPWHRCRAVATQGTIAWRCDLRRLHNGPHAYDWGTWVDRWTELTQNDGSGGES